MVLIRQVLEAEPHVVVRYEAETLTVNGLSVDFGTVIEYSESCATVSDDPAIQFVVEALPSATEIVAEPIEYAPTPPDSCTRFQGLRALGRLRVEQIKAVMSDLENLVLYEIDGVGVTLSEDEVFAIRTAWEEAGSFERLSPDLAFVMWLFGWKDEMRDAFFLWIGEGNIGVFPG